jgi:hypothetical protein
LGAANAALLMREVSGSGLGASSMWKRLVLWRARTKGSGTVEGRKRKEGETRGRKKSVVV